MAFYDKWFSKKGQLPLEAGNPALLQAMHNVALQDNTDTRKQLYSALLEATLIIPIPEVPAGLKPGANISDDKVQLQMAVLQDKGHRKVTPVFTDVEALRTWDPNTPYAGFKAQEFFKIVVGTDVQDIIVNPFDPIRKMVRPGGRITRAEFDVLATGVMPSAFTKSGVEYKIGGGQQAMIGIPAKKPSDEVLEHLRAMSDSIGEIRELYLYQIATQTDGSWSSHTVIGIRLSEEASQTSEKEIIQRLGQSAQTKLERGESLDFSVIHGNLEQIRKSAVLIFQRG